MKRSIEYESLKEFKQDEDLRLKGIAFDRLDDYFRKIIKHGGAAGVLAGLSLNYKMRIESSEDLVYKLAEHFRKHLNSVYKDENS